MEIPTERTPLRHESVPPYVFITNQNRAYRNKIRRFQCCICAGLLSIFITALVITVSYSVNHDKEDDKNSTVSNSTDDSILTTLLLLNWPIQDKPHPKFDDPINDTEIQDALSQGQKSLEQKETFEEKVPALQVNSPSYRHQMATKTSPVARNLARLGFIMEAATKHIYSKRPKSVGKRYTGKFHSELLPPEVCNPVRREICKKSLYRTADGTCNNLAHPRSWGVAMRPFRRILPAQYADGVSAPRKAKDGSNLPPARQISLEVHRPFYRDDPNFTVMLAVWGQFIDHDVTATALSQGKGGNTISCCYAYRESALKNHPECYTVSIQSPDPYFDQYNVTCMEFVRSSPSPTCTFGPREQMNQATSFLDASVVYGTSEGLMKQLRTLQGGELKMLLAPDGRELLPVSTDTNDGCNQEEQLKQGRYCFLSGDPRSNENIHLTTMHLLFARQHNQITRKLSKINPKWDDEKLFQEARKIISAEIQHITYNEFLPVILGPHLMTKLKMTPRSENFSSVYDPNLNPAIANSFAASAFRFGHTLLPGLVRMIAGDNSSDEYVEMHKMLFNPFQLYNKGFLEKAVRGAITTNVEKVDTYFNPQFTQHLFERKPSIGRPKGLCGLDLVSLNVQRGRDHGLPGYPSFREHCGLSRPQTFEDLETEMDSGSLDLIKKLYKTVDDIDMYTGALSEIPLNGSLLGPTVTCLLTDQFLRLQRGDRFWYETSEQPQAFTPAQLDVIRGLSLARLICDTSGIAQAQSKVMESIKPGNERRDCQDLPELDLTPWKETSLPSVETLYDKPGKTWLIKNATPQSPELVKLSGYVESGNINVQGISLWSGTLPIKFTTDIFQAVSDVSNPIVYPPVYANGIIWSASKVESKKIMGNFSLPFYDQNGNINWYNGDFSLQVQWIDSINDEFLTGIHSSPVYFTNESDFQIAPLFESSTKIPSSDTPELAENGRPAPLVINGALDSNFFTWFGNFTLIISKPSKPINGEILQLAYTPKSYTRFIKIGGKISGGTISAQGSEIWSGNLPMAIPVDPFDTIVDSNDSPVTSPVFYGHGINWKGSILSKSPNSATLSGAFSLPRFVHSNGIAPFSIQWYNGDCLLDFDILWHSTFDSGLGIAGNFTTNVYFSDRRQYDYLKNDPPETIFHEMGFASTPKQFNGPSSKLILSGAYSNDGKYFIWSGNFTLILPQQIPITKSEENQSLRLIGGKVSVNGRNIWYNTLPLGIPLKNLVKIFWTGSVQTVSEGFIQIQGSFSFPIYNSSWINGNFDLQFQSNETFSLSGQFESPIRLLENPTSIQEVEQNSISGLDKFLTISPKEGQQNYTNLPVTLLGIFSTDKTEFLWSGQCIFEKPVPIILQSDFVDNSRMKISGVVDSGSFGVPPADLPLSLFASVLTNSSTRNEPPVYGQGLLWKGSLQNRSTLLVNFSLPVAETEKLSWYNGNFSINLGNNTMPYFHNLQTFSSPVFLKAKKPVGRSTSRAFKYPTIEEAVIGPDSTQSAPMILFGEYLPDKKHFRWNGEATFFLPKIPKQPMVEPVSNHLVLSAYTNGGSITNAGSVIWLGNRIPLSIPSQFLLPFETVDRPLDGHGIPWQGYISSGTTKTVKIWGTYSLPKNERDWYNGDFAFELKLHQGLETNVQINGTHLTYFYYQEIKSNSNMMPEWTFGVDTKTVPLPETLPNNTKDFIPVILYGTFSPDRLLFTWSGNVTVIIRNETLLD